MKQRVAARLLLASCTLALGLGLGAAVAVVGVLDLSHPSRTVRSPGQAEGHLDRGVHELSTSSDGPGGGPPVPASRPACTVTDGAGRSATEASNDAGFAAVRVERGGLHRVTCTSAVPVTVVVSHRGEGPMAYLAAVGRGLFLAVVLTVLAAVLAARALVTARRLGSGEPSEVASPEHRREEPPEDAAVPK